MYKFNYADVLEDTGQAAREDEATAIEQSIEMLEKAQAAGARSREAIEALFYLRRLWSLLIEDLAKPENDLPESLRADLISIGMWIMRQAENIRTGNSDDFKGLIDVSKIIVAGLK
ncbi:MAG: flagellar biosynthesis regulator FlaF [Rhizobiales bacterium]|nr:flagellar biosynthesis regulator FlaF [Hyphomicrobiales bacterium]